MPLFASPFTLARAGVVMIETAAAMGGGAVLLGAIAVFADAGANEWAQAAGSAILGAGAFGSSWIITSRWAATGSGTTPRPSGGRPS